MATAIKTSGIVIEMSKETFEALRKALGEMYDSLEEEMGLTRIQSQLLTRLYSDLSRLDVE